MKISKIIRGIVGISVVSGIVYAAYRYGEFNGENSEMLRTRISISTIMKMRNFSQHVKNQRIILKKNRTNLHRSAM